MSHKNNTIEIVKGIIAALLLLCLIDADYGFYQAMRTLISFGFAFLTYHYYKINDKKSVIVFLCLLIVFQPLMRIAFGRMIWIVLDISTAAYLLYQVYRYLNTNAVNRIQDKKIEDTGPISTVKKQGSLRINFPDNERY